MSNFVLAKPDDEGTISAGNELSNLPASNLLSRQPIDAWRTSGVASAYINYDLGSAKAIDLIALLFINANTTDTWRIRAADTEPEVTSSPAYDSGSLSMIDAATPSDFYPKHAIQYLTTPQTYRYWRIDVTTTESYFQAGRLYLTSGWQPEINISYDWFIQFIDQSPSVRSIGSNLYTDPRNQYRELNIRLETQTEDELYNNLYEIIRLRGNSLDVLAIRDPAATTQLLKQTIYGVLQGTTPIINPKVDRFSARIQIEEMR